MPNACHAWRVRWLGAGFVLVLVLSCGRTGLEPGDFEELEPVGVGGSFSVPDAGSNAGRDAGVMMDADLPEDAGMDAEPPRDAEVDAEVPMDAAIVPPPVEPPAQHCVPSAEACNGADDDCNGVVDDLPPEACENGGFRYCIAGSLSACPRRCELCMPGGVRICQHSFCTFWGEQECAGDGQSFGACREAQPPPECAGIARQHKGSRELEQCCLDNGYCCLDSYDLDGDGSRSDMVGNCDDVRCD